MLELGRAFRESWFLEGESSLCAGGYAILDTGGFYALVKWFGGRPVISAVILWEFR